MSFPAAERIAVNGISLAVYSAGDGPPVVLCHGFPELAYSWRAQLPALARAGYRAIAPDLRGYGASDKPDGVEPYDILQLTGDMTGLLDALGLERAFFVGHDWGALLLWQLALLAPERMRGYSALNIPFYPRPPVDPMIMMREVLGDEFYIVNFQDSDVADRTFDTDPERFFRSMMRRLPITRAVYDRLGPDKLGPYSMLRAMQKDRSPGEPLLSDTELQVFVDTYRAGGFTPPINWYRNWSRNWALTAGVEQRVRVPVQFIGAVDDVLIAPHHIDAMRRYVDDLSVTMLENCGHWTQQERPDEVNRLLIGWLDERRSGNG